MSSRFKTLEERMNEELGRIKAKVVIRLDFKPKLLTMDFGDWMIFCLLILKRCTLVFNILLLQYLYFNLDFRVIISYINLGIVLDYQQFIYFIFGFSSYDTTKKNCIYFLTLKFEHKKKKKN